MTKKFNGTGSDDPNWGLFYREHTKDMDARKSIKVKLPIRQHIKLHAMKLFGDDNISETVERALDVYFDKLKQEQEAAEASRGGFNGSEGSAVNGSVESSSLNRLG